MWMMVVNVMAVLVGLLYSSPATQGKLHCTNHHHNISARLGASVQLPCHFFWHGEPPRDQKAVWQKKQEAADDLVVAFRNGVDKDDQQEETFVGRASVLGDWFQLRNAGLILRRISHADAGVFQCYVMSVDSNQHHLCTTVHLSVEADMLDGKLNCTHHHHNITARQGTSVQLPCHFSWHGEPPRDQKAVWQKKQEGADDLVVAFRNGADKDDQQEEQFVGRASVLGDWFQQQNAKLMLDRISLADAGILQCHVLSMDSHHHHLCTTVHLSVEADMLDDSNLYAVVWCLAFFLIIMGFLLASFAWMRCIPTKCFVNSKSLFYYVAPASVTLFLVSKDKKR